MPCNLGHLTSAMRLCTHGHQTQKDKAQNPYVCHPLRVAAAGEDLDQVVLGLLHDVVEDTVHTLDEIKQERFPEVIVEALDAISKREGETRETYLCRVAHNELATAVKYHDLNDNADPARLALLGTEEAARLAAKYEEAYELLAAAMSRNEKRKVKLSWPAKTPPAIRPGAFPCGETGAISGIAVFFAARAGVVC